jgi:TolA-binding protein
MFARGLSAVSVLLVLVAAVAVTTAVALTGVALNSANDSLGTVDADLTSVSSHADPLTYQIHTVNNSLVQIQSSLQPLSGQANQINGLLGGINQTLVSADASVADINSKAGPIESTLADSDARLGLGPTGEANEVGPSRATAKVNLLGTQVQQLLAVLVPVQSDLSDTSGLLSQTNTHLHSICTTGILGPDPLGSC